MIQYRNTRFQTSQNNSLDSKPRLTRGVFPLSPKTIILYYTTILTFIQMLIKYNSQHSEQSTGDYPITVFALKIYSIIVYTVCIIAFTI